jgi:hypothetical protein
MNYNVSNNNMTGTSLILTLGTIEEDIEDNDNESLEYNINDKNGKIILLKKFPKRFFVFD